MNDRLMGFSGRFIPTGGHCYLTQGDNGNRTVIPCALALFGALAPHQDPVTYRLGINSSPCQLDNHTSSSSSAFDQPTALLVQRGGGCSFSEKVRKKDEILIVHHISISSNQSPFSYACGPIDLPCIIGSY